MTETLTYEPQQAAEPQQLSEVSLQQQENFLDQPGISIPGEFQSITTQLYAETDLGHREELKATAASLISPVLESLQDEEVPAFLGALNESHKGVFDGQELTLLSARREKIVMVNDKGELEEMVVTAENATNVLRAVKASDVETRRGNSYALRREILKRSEGQILTHQAYTYAEEIPQGHELDTFLDNPENWIPERREIHEVVVNQEYELAQQLSGRLDDAEPTVYTLRGNTAAGKTTAVRANPSFTKALDSHGEPSGSINPDTYKGILRNVEIEEGKHVVSWQQSHEEGSMIARSIQSRISDSESSMVIDKRMAKSKNIDELMALAEKTGKKVKILDVDVPLELSLVRVIGRRVDGNAPTVPFDAIAEGFRDIRKSRAQLLQRAKEESGITEYVLMAAGEDGRSVEVARKVGEGEISIPEATNDLFQQTVDSQTIEQTIQQLAETVITEEYIDSYIKRAYSDSPTGSYAQATRDSLAPHMGKTLKQALDERSMQLN